MGWAEQCCDAKQTKRLYDSTISFFSLWNEKQSECISKNTPPSLEKDPLNVEMIGRGTWVKVDTKLRIKEWIYICIKWPVTQKTGNFSRNLIKTILIEFGPNIILKTHFNSIFACNTHHILLIST